MWIRLSGSRSFPDTRRADEQPVFLDRSNVGVAMWASGAVPGIISPVAIRSVEQEDTDESLPLAPFAQPGRQVHSS